MGFYDRLKNALSGTGATARANAPDPKQMPSTEQLPYEATFGYVFFRFSTHKLEGGRKRTGNTPECMQ